LIYVVVSTGQPALSKVAADCQSYDEHAFAPAHIGGHGRLLEIISRVRTEQRLTGLESISSPVHVNSRVSRA